MSQYGNSCALTILKGHEDHPIEAHAPIHKKHDPTRAATQQPSTRFATSFSQTGPRAASTGFDSSVNVHTVSDEFVLLPFLDRPSEVKELLFDTKANESLMYRLCSVFCGNTEDPLQRGQDERWDEMLELLIELDRPLLDDEDWLARLESLVMERSPALWAQLARCLGAEGITARPARQPNSSRFDSWALPSQYDNDSPLSTPSAASSEEYADHVDVRPHRQRSLSVNVQPLDALPQSFSEKPAAKLQQSSLRESLSPVTSQAQLASEPANRDSAGNAGGEASASAIFSMSTGGDDGSLEDIMEEPGSSTHIGPRRARSHSGKFAGLRIAAFTSSSSPPTSRRTSAASDMLSPRNKGDDSPLPTGAMSPAGHAPSSPGDSPSRTAPIGFTKHRRLSTVLVQNAPQKQDQTTSGVGESARPRTSSTASRRQRGVSEAGSLQQQGTDFGSQPRRRALSFARSFAELKPPTEHLEQLRAEYAQREADRLADQTRRISLEDTAAASAPAAPEGALGLKASDDSSSTLLDPASASVMADKPRKGSLTRRAGPTISPGSVSPSLPGLLPDGRTRHPSGSYGSRDLSESIALFRAKMGLSTSPSPSEYGGDGHSDAGKSIDSAARKRKGSEPVEKPKPTSRTADTAEAKISRKAAVPNTEQYEQPKHMQEIQSRHRSSTASGSGLALGGGFSLAKSGANFRRQSHDSGAGSSHSGPAWKSNFARSGAASYRSPPPVHRRPGGFVSLAQEYERARNHRRSSESVFSMHSNALESSPSSSVASHDLPNEEKPAPRVEAPVDTTGEPTPRPGATPRASFASRPGKQGGYPFPNLVQQEKLAPVTPLSAPLRSPSIVFPIPPSPSISRALEFQKSLEAPRCRDAFDRMSTVCGDHVAAEVKELITTSERSHMPDEKLLEVVAGLIGLVDHEQSAKVGGREAMEADLKLAEEGYAEKWEVFAGLCRSLGMGEYELSMAKRRCGPAIDLCR